MILVFNAHAFAKPKKTLVHKPTPNFCKLMDSPKELYNAKPHELASLAQWRSEMLTATQKQEVLLQNCLSTCPNPSAEMQMFCEGLGECQKHCHTSKVIQNSNCTKSNVCVQMGCSPMPPRADFNQFINRDEVIRSKIFIMMANRIVNEFINTNVDSLAYDLSDNYKTNFDFAKNFLLYRPTKDKSYARYLSQTMRCLNHSENKLLEPIMQNNSYSSGQECSHAFGLGQIMPETFYSIFGILTSGVLSVQPFKNPCKAGLTEFPIKDLPRACGNKNFQSQYYRIELFKKYKHFTPQEIHELRAFDTELQIRLMLAVIINKIIQTRDWNSAFSSYGNSSYSKYTGDHSCVQKNLLNRLVEK